MVVMLLVLRVRLRGFEMGQMLKSVGKTVFASAAAGAACWIATLVVDAFFHSPGHVKIHAALTLIAGFGIGGFVYIAIAVLLKMDELKQAGSMLRRKKRATPV
jgi:peptidoglycan biosynthesis protein MviN/MurJ (putative lipid II flippase)